ncbi:MAG TPA: RelA/SpoT domain-containing protein, partial [Peptostreptococcaceae bacterium]|nr:RelA/SpoT domain-containing protein [Peptostreptococcaceae bacterium]
REDFLKKYKISEEYLIENNIDLKDLNEIYIDYNNYKANYETQAELIANILRGNQYVHSVKTRAKDSEHLIEKIIRKTPERREKYGKDFKFTVDNYRDEITDLLGIRVIHLFKEDWEKIHDFVTRMWNVNEIVANVREGDITKKFEELGITVRSRISGYRSVHYIIESYPTNQKIIAEVQVRTIFEEGYGEIDHQLRYSHDEIPEVLQLNLLLLNRIAGSSDEMASLINVLNKSFEDIKEDYEEKLNDKDRQILKLKEKINSSEDINKEDLLITIDNIIKN